ncbi:CYFA0S05e05138g1_1 [Cyberlindnera fabianii]|uniref:1,3-beta-glucanosyltransferase n=1 Tax=Cyberlindnera fabianii TaxID=36022 RepID=A0A061AZM3_CYBFA|nr:CYFA0S05e05138g1_1 [Cyberlindnera fabianii]
MKFQLQILLAALTVANAAAITPVETALKKTTELHAMTQAPTPSNGTYVMTTNVSQRSKTNPIEIVGRKFFDSVTKEQFFLKGIAYQPSRATNDAIAIKYHGLTIIDPMLETRLCMRDLPYLKSLGVNTIRVYAIDTDKSHDECFEAYANAGIYVLADLSEPDLSVNRKSPSWDTDLFLRYKSVVDALHSYDNVLGFFAGNEVTNDKTNTNASPFVKSAIRDTKEYIKEQGYRKIPVGYASNDDTDTRGNLASYFSCGELSADFYGINMYEWCGYSSFYTSGFKERTEEFKNSKIPVFFSEFGCNLERPRPFTEVDALFSHLMTDVWSGGLAYMYFEEPNEYGVVQVDSEGSIVPLADYHNLQKAYLRSHAVGVDYEEYKRKLSSPSSVDSHCPGLSNIWKASEELPNYPDAVKCDCMESSLQCKLSTSVKKTDYSRVFEYACGEIDCFQISADGEAGEYGAFSDCSIYQKASFVLNEVFKQQGSKAGGCDFEGVAQLSRSLATKSQLSAKTISSGQTCYEFLDTLPRTVADKNPKSVRNFTDGLSDDNDRDHNSSSHEGHQALENRAAQQKFYNNLLWESIGAVIVVGLSIFMS